MPLNRFLVNHAHQQGEYFLLFHRWLLIFDDCHSIRNDYS